MKLTDQYKAAKYKFQGNGPRSIDTLKEALNSIQEDRFADLYGKGEIIEEFEKKFAVILGKESAVFMPSGTMAQQIALRIYADDKNNKKIAYHPLSHLELHEQDAIKILHGLETVLLGEPNRLFTIKDLMSVEENVGTLLIELPQREIGGYLPALNELEEIIEYARSKNMYTHLDGARLFESLPYYEKSPAEIAAYFDSVYISFYKGMGAVAGAVLAGKKDFIDKAKIWKRRHGGDLISLYPYIIAANYYYEKRKGMMSKFHEEAIELAKYFNDLPSVCTTPEIPMTNMFHVHADFSSDQLEKIVSKIFSEFDVSIAGGIKKIDEKTSKFEISIGEEFSKIPKELLKQVFGRLNEYIKVRS